MKGRGRDFKVTLLLWLWEGPGDVEGLDEMFVHTLAINRTINRMENTGK